MKKKGEFYFALFFAVLGLSVLVISLSFRYWEAIMLPAIIGGLLFITATIESIKQFTQKPSVTDDKPAKPEKQPKAQRLTGIYLISWVVSFMLAIYLFGFLIAIPLFAFLYLIWRKRKWLAAIIFALIADAVIYLVFELALRSALYRGLVFGG